MGNDPARIVYRCQVCSRVVPARTPATRLVTEARDRTYAFRPSANRVVRLDASGKQKVFWIDDPGGVGREAVREVIACPDCAGRLGR